MAAFQTACAASFFREQQFQNVQGLFPALQQAAPAGFAVADHSIRGKLGTIRLEVSCLAPPGEWAGTCGRPPPHSVWGPAWRCWGCRGPQIHPAEPGLFVVFRQFHHVNVHFAHQGSDGVLDVALLHGQPSSPGWSFSPRGNRGRETPDRYQ